MRFLTALCSVILFIVFLNVVLFIVDCLILGEVFSLILGPTVILPALLFGSLLFLFLAPKTC